MPSYVKVVDALSSPAKDSLAAKIWKTKVFEVVSEPRVLFPWLFLDSDMQVTRPLPPFLLKGPWAHGCNVYFTHERWFVKDSAWNSGVVLLDRRMSHAFLAAWRREIASYRYVRDQYALMAVLQNGTSRRQFIACQMPTEQVKVRYELDILNHVWARVAPRHYASHAPPFVHYTHEKTNVKSCARSSRRV